MQLKRQKVNWPAATCSQAHFTFCSFYIRIIDLCTPQFYLDIVDFNGFNLSGPINSQPEKLGPSLRVL